MKLYDKKFLIYGNCMIRSFGQPGKVVLRVETFSPVFFSQNSGVLKLDFRWWSEKN